MFKEIEKEYKGTLKENKFNSFYWKNAGFACIVSLIISKLINNTLAIIFCYIYIITKLIIYFYKDYKETTKKINLKKESITKRVKIYISQIKPNHVDNVLNILSSYNFRTKNDLKLVIDYYNSKQPITLESSPLGWIVSVALTIASFIEIAYDSNTQTINFNKLSLILNSTSIYIILIVIPIIIIKFIINIIIIPKRKLYSQLSEDLSFIYLNFNKYKNKLSKKDE